MISLHFDWKLLAFIILSYGCYHYYNTSAVMFAVCLIGLMAVAAKVVYNFLEFCSGGW